MSVATLIQIKKVSIRKNIHISPYFGCRRQNKTARYMKNSPKIEKPRRPLYKMKRQYPISLPYTQFSKRPVPIIQVFKSVGQTHLSRFSLSVEAVRHTPVSAQLKKPSKANLKCT